MSSWRALLQVFSRPGEFNQHCWIGCLSFTPLFREQVEPLVKGVPGNIHQGFDSYIQTEYTYVVAFAMVTLHVLPPQENSQLAPLPITPMPPAVMAAFSLTSSDFLEAEWHVVFKSKRPRRYPAW
jgi:hypothetical protein